MEGPVQSLFLALHDLAPVVDGDPVDAAAVHNAESYAWFGLAAYLQGDKDWSTGVEREAGLPYEPVAADLRGVLG